MLIDEAIFRLLLRTIQKEGWLELPATGNSMFPYIQKGDKCRFVPCDPSALNKGDVVLFLSSSNQLIAHRFVKRTESQHIHNKFVFKGDTNLGFDQPVENCRLIGKLTYVKKKHVTFTSDDVMARIWAYLILAFPIISSFLRRYLNGKTNNNLKIDGVS
ncbi:hypothetical protein J7I80_08290 [Bacillus sp. ISL-41]|uniref:hypothetical protein n=1 Tax=Bacillus sp. ISL-41 TaxID=2819127 RepID=UPI001BE81E9A|nr:hypothetical protein [Bacillus sp. ISL-41]MBT2642221.1 hypothetical protein [Bacillus sp. ISL-41]